MAVLIQLIKARLDPSRSDVLSKDDLINSVWKGAIVSDHSVANTISDLRRVLGDSRTQPSYIETIPKRGYRLVASAYQSEAKPTQSTRKNIRVLTYVVGLLTLTGVLLALIMGHHEKPRLWFLNIQNSSGEQSLDLATLAAGEMLTVALAESDYRLIRLRSDELILADNPPFDTIKPQLTDRLLQGQVIKTGEDASLVLQILDAQDHAVLWAENYPFDGHRFADLTRNVLADLGEPLGIKTTPQPITDNPQLSAAYWRARYLWSLRELEPITAALNILNDVLEINPNFAPAHAAIADIYAHKTANELGLDRNETYRLAEQHLAKAYEIDPQLSDGLLTLAYLSFFKDGDANSAISHINQLIEQRPDYALAWQTKAMIASAMGDADLSLTAIEEARKLDPLSPSILWDTVWFLYLKQDYEQALNAAAIARRVSPPVHIYEALIHLARNDHQAAVQSWLAWAEARGLENWESEIILASYRPEQANDALNRLAELAQSHIYKEHPVLLAALLNEIGQEDDAISVLTNDPVREKSWWWSWYPVMPAFESIRNHPEQPRFVNALPYQSRLTELTQQAD